jgi:hypothetical protein
MEAYAGPAAPFNFNGLVRHYFLRTQPEMGDVMVSLLPKGSAAGRVTPLRSTCAKGCGLAPCLRAG